MTDLATRPEQSNGYHKTITEHYASMSDALHHRDELVSQVKELETDLTVAQKLNIEYKEQLRIITEERDYYYRKAYAYTNTLSSARNQIQAMLDLADHEAEHPRPPQKMSSVANLETKSDA